MRFDSFAELLAMGGHGLYVWLSYGAAVTIILYNVVSVRRAERRFFQEARDGQRRRAARESRGSDRPIAGPAAPPSADHPRGSASTGES